MLQHPTDVPEKLRPTQSDHPIGGYGKPVEQTNEVAYALISLARAAAFPRSD